MKSCIVALLLAAPTFAQETTFNPIEIPDGCELKTGKGCEEFFAKQKMRDEMMREAIAGGQIGDTLNCLEI